MDMSLSRKAYNISKTVSCAPIEGTHLLSLAFISSTTSQSNRASCDVGPCVLLASRAASMALAVALSERGAIIDRREIGTGAKAAEDQMRAATRRSFMMG